MISFLLLNISTIISSKTINILQFLFGIYSSIFSSISSISLEYSINTLESFKCFKPVHSLLLVSNLYFSSYRSLAYGKFHYYIKQCIYFSKSRTYTYWFSVWMVRNLWPIWVVFFYVSFYNLIKVNHLCIALFFFLTY